jgi:hypothetical protein
MDNKIVEAKVVQLKTQLVKEGHTRHLLAETDLMTLRIHCYSPGIGQTRCTLTLKRITSSWF